MNVFLLLFALATAKPAYIPILTARSTTTGTAVTVMGLVTVPSGRFRSSSEDEGFAIQDQTAGIWVSLQKNLHLHDGDRVLVTGTLANGAGKLQINADPANVKRLAGRALRVATGQVKTTIAGYLIAVEGTVTQSPQRDKQYGWKMLLDDGTGPILVYLNRSTDIDPHSPSLKAGHRLHVTGFANQYEQNPEVDPRSRRDLRALP